MIDIAERIYKRRVFEEQRERERALRAAKRIALILAKKFGAKKVILYGSLSKEGIFDVASDIDLVAEGLGKSFLKAYGYCLSICDFDLDIKDYQELPQAFKKILKHEGRTLYG